MAVGHPTRSSSFLIENIIGNPNQGQPWSMLTKMDSKQLLPTHSSSPHQFLQPLLQDATVIPSHTAPQSCQTSSHNSSILTTTIDSKTNIHATTLRHHQQTDTREECDKLTLLHKKKNNNQDEAIKSHHVPIDDNDLGESSNVQSLDPSLQDEQEEDESLSSRHHRRRILFSSQQVEILQNRFQFNSYLSPIEREQLARKLHLSPKQVKVWFQNQRYKKRKKFKQSIQDSYISIVNTIVTSNPFYANSHYVAAHPFTQYQPICTTSYK